MVNNVKVVVNEELNDVSKMKSNVRLYTKYKAFAFDVLFYYAISIPYFLQAKSMEMAQVLFLFSVYSLSLALWQPISNYIVEKFGLKNSIVVGNVLFSLMIILYLLGDSFAVFSFGALVGALGLSLKSISESTILFESLAKLDKTDQFAKYEGIANSRYFYLDAITAVIAGLTFLVNPYIPFILCLVCILISLYLSLKFFPTSNNIVQKIPIKEYVSGLKTILSSSRSKSILLFALIISGTITLSMSMYKAIILDFGLTADILAYIVCGYGILLGIGSKFAHIFERKTKNKTLMIFLIGFCAMVGIIGIAGLTSVLTSFKIAAIAICLAIMGLIHGMYRIAIKKYVINFTTQKVRTKITSLYYMAENLGGTILLFVSGLLLPIFNNALTTIIMIVFVLITAIIVVNYTNKRFGLKPEDYKPDDINNVDITANSSK